MKNLLKHTGTVVLFLILFAATFYLNVGETLGLYGAVLFLYLASKMLFSFIYKPATALPLDYKVDAVIPSYNEDGDGIIETVESVLEQTYPINKVYIIDDGSPDITGYEKVKAWLDANPQRKDKVVLHRLLPNAGKRHAQAWAFSRSDADVFFTVDSDSYVYPNALYELLRTFTDPQVYAATGHINARNRNENLLTRLIDIRYDNAFRVERAAQSVTGNILTCSGPLSIYRREVVMDNLEHYTNQFFLGVRMTMGDDRCLTNYANRLGKTKYQSTALCTTDVPNNLPQFIKQQIRWNKSFFRESLIALQMGLQRPMVAAWSIVEVLLFMLLNISTARMLWVAVTSGEVIDWKYLIIALAGIVVSAFLRNIHYAMKQPFLFLLSPIYGILHLLLLQPLRLYALMTIKDVSWGTRTAKVNDDAGENEA